MAMAYKLEKLNNFRWAGQLGIAPKSKYKLSKKDIPPDSERIQQELAVIGQFAELSLSVFRPALVWKHLELLSRSDYPLEHYHALKDTILVAPFRGRVADVQGIVVYRPPTKQLFVSFSGTSNFAQAVEDLKSILLVYPYHSDRSTRVHAGFLRIYSGLRDLAMEKCRLGMEQHDVQELICTGHSMGGVISTYFTLDCLSEDVPGGRNVRLVTFGSPRPGDIKFAQLFQEEAKKYHEKYGEDKFTEIAVRGYKDGVPALPPSFFGYRHISLNAFFLHHGCLYRIPPNERESTSFNVEHDEDGYSAESVIHPRGGHNYYNGRDMERLIRRMEWLSIAADEFSDDWENRYMARVAQERRVLSDLGKKPFRSPSRFVSRRRMSG